MSTSYAVLTGGRQGSDEQMGAEGVFPQQGARAGLFCARSCGLDTANVQNEMR